MTYVSWAAIHEGSTDQAYLEILIPAVMEDLVRSRGTRNVTVPQNPAVRLGKSGRSVDEVAKEICDEKASFHIVFIHADTGGRALEAGMAHRSTAYRDAAHELCEFLKERCVIVAPRHESEAWILADRAAIGSALGYNGDLVALGLPASAEDAEKLVDPKKVLLEAIQKVRGRRSHFHIEQFIPAVAQRQRLADLRRSKSFRAFESALAGALVSLGCLA